jgi:hypothetical protein
VKKVEKVERSMGLMDLVAGNVNEFASIIEN